MVRLRHRPDLVGFDSPSEMSPAKASIRDAIQRYKAGIPTEDLLAIAAEEIAEPRSSSPACTSTSGATRRTPRCGERRSTSSRT